MRYENKVEKVTTATKLRNEPFIITNQQVISQATNHKSCLQVVAVWLK
jgi:hypothetical protein